MKINFLSFLLLLLFSAISMTGCNKEEDESDEVCTSGCTVVRGKILTSEDRPLTV